MIKKRLLLAALLSPLLILVVIYLAWPLWSPPMLRTLLADHDIELLKADIARPGWHELVISDVSLRYRTAEHVTTLSVPRLELSYSPGQLLRDHIEIVEVPAAHLKLELDASVEPVSSEPFSIPLIFPETIFSQLPLAQLHVDSLQLVVPENDDYQMLDGNLHYSDGQLALNLSNRGRAEGSTPELELTVRADRENRLQLSLQKNAQPIVELESQIIDDSSQLKGELAIDLQAGSELLKQLKVLDSGYQVTGMSQLSWQALLPETIDENSWRQLELAGSLSSEGALVAERVAQNGFEQMQFKIAADFGAEGGSATVDVSELSLDGQLDLPSKLASTLPAKSLKALPVTLRVAPASQLHVDLQSLELEMQQGDVELVVGRPESALFATLQLQSLKLQPLDDWTATARFQAQGDIKRLKYEQTSVEEIAFSTAGRAGVNADSIHLKLEANSSLEAKTVKVDQAKIPRVEVGIPRAFEVVWQQQKITIADVALDIAGTQLTQRDQHIQAASASVQLKDFSLDLTQAPQLASDIDSSVTGIKVTAGDFRFKPLDLQSSWQLRGEVVTGNLQFSDRAGLIKLKGDLKHQLGSGRGSLDAQLDTLEFQRNKTYLPNLIENWAYPLDLFAGQLAANALLSWDVSQTYVKGRVRLSDVGGFYDTNLFHGMNTEFLIDAPLADLSVMAEQFKVDSLDVGIPIENVTFALQSTPENIQLRDFKAELLGGEVGQKLISYDWTQDDNELLLQVEGVELSELLQLELGIEGYGVLDGELPLRIGPDGVSMALGKIQARSAGVIKYEGGQSVSDAAANIGVGFALEALNNFHYDVLDIKADYSENGELNLAAALLGRNPDMQEQSPVRYNINIKEDIPALIESLKLTQDISDDIERRLKAFYDQ